MERGAASGEHLQGSAPGKQRPDEFGSCRNNMFTVVQQQQCLAGAQRTAEIVEERAIRRWDHPKSRGDCGRHQHRIG
jgi:hypothetical protein